MPRVPHHHSVSFYKELGRRIQENRKLREMTQGELASRVSLKRTSITNIENGEQKLLVHTLAGIAVALEVTLDELIPANFTTPEEVFNESVQGIGAGFEDWMRNVVLPHRNGAPDGSAV